MRFRVVCEDPHPEYGGRTEILCATIEDARRELDTTRQAAAGMDPEPVAWIEDAEGKVIR